MFAQRIMCQAHYSSPRSNADAFFQWCAKWPLSFFLSIDVLWEIRSRVSSYHAGILKPIAHLGDMLI